MTREAENTLINQLLRQLTEVERKIDELEAEKLALQRLITKARQQDIATRDVTRKNSFNRILVENQILKVLGAAERPVAARDLLLEARLVNFQLKDSTFRSYLHRMKQSGLIESVPGLRGYWKLPKEAPDPPGGVVLS